LCSLPIANPLDIAPPLTQWAEWYRSWNAVVGDSLRYYLYLDAQRLGLPRLVSLFAVFAYSAVLHEVILSFAFDMFNPVLFVFFCGPGIALLWVSRSFSPRFARVFLWLALSLGASLIFAA
jgi:hypothetical protein